jgi:hypothetical protein
MKIKYLFSSQFWRFQSVIDWPLCFGSVARSVPHGGDGVKLSFSSPGNKRERKRLRSHNTLECIPPKTQGSPTRFCLLKVPPSPNSAIRGSENLTMSLWGYSRPKLLQCGTHLLNLCLILLPFNVNQ